MCIKSVTEIKTNRTFISYIKYIVFLYYYVVCGMPQGLFLCYNTRTPLTTSILWIHKGAHSFSKTDAKAMRKVRLQSHQSVSSLKKKQQFCASCIADYTFCCCWCCCCCCYYSCVLSYTIRRTTCTFILIVTPFNTNTCCVMVKCVTCCCTKNSNNSSSSKGSKGSRQGFSISINKEEKKTLCLLRLTGL